MEFATGPGWYTVRHAAGQAFDLPSAQPADVVDGVHAVAGEDVQHVHSAGVPGDVARRLEVGDGHRVDGAALLDARFERRNRGQMPPLVPDHGRAVVDFGVVGQQLDGVQRDGRRLLDEEVAALAQDVVRRFEDVLGRHDDVDDFRVDLVQHLLVVGVDLGHLPASGGLLRLLRDEVAERRQLDVRLCCDGGVVAPVRLLSGSDERGAYP